MFCFCLAGSGHGLGFAVAVLFQLACSLQRQKMEGLLGLRLYMYLRR